MGMMVFIVGALVTFIGALFIICGVSLQSKESEQRWGDEEKRALLSQEDGSKGERAVQKIRKAIVPDEAEFGKEFIEKELIKIKRSPNVVAAYFTALEARFKMRQQRKIIKELKRQYEFLAGGVAAETRFIESLAKREEAGANLKKAQVKREYALEIERQQTETKLKKYQGALEEEEIKAEERKLRKDELKIEREISLDPEIIAERKAAAKQRIREERAKSEAKIREYEQQGKETPLPRAIGGSELESSPSSPMSQQERVRERALGQAQMRADDKYELHKWRQEELKKIDQQGAKWLKEIDESDLPEDLKEIRKMEIEAELARLRESILKENPFRH